MYVCVRVTVLERKGGCGGGGAAWSSGSEEVTVGATMFPVALATQRGIYPSRAFTFFLSSVSV